VGHYDHGCRLARLLDLAREEGFALIDSRCSHTALTCFWMELMFTFPLVAMAATPLARLAYALEWRLPPRPGVNLLVGFRKTGPGATDGGRE
jgi:hypothetical protein